MYKKSQLQGLWLKIPNIKCGHKVDITIDLLTNGLCVS